MNVLKNEKGITLISLIVTIIIMLILAVVSIYYAKSGIIDKTKTAIEITAQSAVEEKVNLAVETCKIDYYSENSEMDLMNYIKLNLSKYLSEFDDVKFIEKENKLLLKCKYNGKDYEINIGNEGNISFGVELKGNVKVGDYIKYDKEYQEDSLGKEYNAENGWVVIDDGVMKGTSGKVKIMSYAIVGKWLYNMEENADEKLKNNFINEEIFEYDGKNHSVSEYMNNKIAEKISVLSLEELNKAYNNMYKTNREENDASEITQSDGDIFNNSKINSYWLATSKEGKLYSVTNKNIMNFPSVQASEVRNGVKLVITLKQGLIANCENNLWEIMVE